MDAEITAFLSLILILLISLAAALLESGSIQLAKNYRRADVNRAMDCMFAEYQKELLEDYEIFGLDGSYETGSYGEDQLTDRLSYYAGGEGQHRIRKIRFLTDDGGAEFYQQAVRCMESRYGLDLVEEWMGDTSVWNRQDSQTGDMLEDEQEKQTELQDLLEANEGTLPREDNPIEHVDVMKQSPILSLVMPKDQTVSEKEVDADQLLANRDLNGGYGDFGEEGYRSGKVYDLLFGEYLLKYFTAFTDEEKTGALDYELEYILEGKNSDRSNLEGVVLKLMLLRFVPNYIYIQTDGEMKAEAEAMALTLCSLLAVPAITEAAAQVILLAWAYGETVMDLRSLLSGSRVALVKTKEDWQLTLPALLKLGTPEDPGEGRDGKNGLTYRDYLRILLYLESPDASGLRALDMIERTLADTRGLTFFRADYCVSRMEVQSVFTFRRGIRYQFATCYGYR